MGSAGRSAPKIPAVSVASAVLVVSATRCGSPRSAFSQDTYRMFSQTRSSWAGSKAAVTAGWAGAQVATWPGRRSTRAFPRPACSTGFPSST